jgi:hypothetical protein
LKVQRGKLNGTSRSFPPLFSIYRGVEWSAGFRTCLIIPPCQPLDAGCRMPDDRRSHSKPENLDLHALCAKRITRLFPE